MNNIINHKLLIIILNECFLFEYILDCNLLLQWKKLYIFTSLFNFFGLLLLNIFFLWKLTYSSEFFDEYKVQKNITYLKIDFLCVNLRAITVTFDQFNVS